MRIAAFALLSVCSLVALMFCREQSRDWTEVKEWVRTEFPGVTHVSVEELAALLRAESDAPSPVLLDVREEPEYVVSHLPGALRVAPGSDVSSVDALNELTKDTAIVAYCSVGYRSSQLVSALRAKGFTNVRNLEGSIFEWANHGLPLERGGIDVNEVHPFDEEWGRYLKRELWAWEPGVANEKE